ncbi:MAG: glucose-6-phosphate isomerase [Gracilibacter sp. BRH_c7a]|nr:MAG: glucose-6-phosphate isomerase [Gracilibacter sp. BRH_c7a]
MDKKKYGDRFSRYLFIDEELGLQLDISRIKFTDSFFKDMEPKMKLAYTRMQELEKGAISNPDENRMVGHYWLRNPEIAPDRSIAVEISQTIESVKRFTKDIHMGKIRGEKGRLFENLLVIGIGGSSLGPRFIAEALGSDRNILQPYFLDNTDPDGIDRVLSHLEDELDKTLVIVVSKSGGTIETRNSMEEVKYFYSLKNLNFAKHAISITQPGSLLASISRKEEWLMGFPMWDWIGGRTSVLSAVGILPLALQGINIDLLLEGAKRCDELTRKENTSENPSALLALMWYTSTGGQGGKQMVMLPYKDRLELLAKYLQQLIMESLGKELDLDGKVVRQGIAVLGNKGSTDQHSYLQQLLEGPDNFFVTFIEVLQDREGISPIIAEKSTSGDYLHAFLLGTREALTTKGRESLTITIQKIDEFSLGVLLALFERAVSFYAFLVNINAYHQPAVEMGKKGAREIIKMKNQILSFLQSNQGKRYTILELAHNIDREEDMESLYKILLHLVNNPGHEVKREKNTGENNPFKDLFWSN